MNDGLTLGSLFSGSGGFELGGMLAGITPVWNSEIEPFPIRVTTKRLPFVKHYGDINKLDGHTLEPVDIITFGSPCTDMSIAGRREGLEGQQSCLFHQAIRIVREMREETNGLYPRYIVWENVKGAFSSNGGEDFRTVLEEVCQIKKPGVPIPRYEKWQNAGIVLGDGFSVAWRLLDAQYWGVPQRRERIYLVADFAGRGVGEILFESEGLSGYSAAGFRAWQEAAGCTGGSAAEPGLLCLNDQGGIRMDVTEGVANTLRAESHHPPLVMGRRQDVFENHGKDARYTGPLEVNTTLTAHYGTGGNNQPLVVSREAYGISSKDSNAMKSSNPHSGFYKADTARTLDANGGNPGCNQGGIAIVEEVKTFDVRQSSDGTINRRTHAYESDTSRTVDRTGNVPGTNHGGIAVVELAYCASKNSYFTSASEEVAGSLVATDYKDPPLVNRHSAVRRLTPIECARLQGFPGWWCDGLEQLAPTEKEIQFWMDVFEEHRLAVGKAKKPKTRNQIIKWLKEPYRDSAAYKMWGNGVALPCVFFVLAGIVYFSEKSTE